MNRRATLSLVSAAIAIAAGAVLVTTSLPSEHPTATPAPTTLGDVGVQLEQLPTTDPTAVVPDYRRDEFGDPWADVDGNGCDTRNDVLTRDLDDVVHMTDRPCIVDTGTLTDPYTGAEIAFEHGEQTSMAVQIDHLIPLALAWRSGAWQWTPEQRLAFANDPTLLLAVDGPTNQSRSDRDLDSWLPPSADFTCSFVSTIVDGLTRYELSITDAARAAAAAALVDCAPATAQPGAAQTITAEAHLDYLRRNP